MRKIIKIYTTRERLEEAKLQFQELILEAKEKSRYFSLSKYSDDNQWASFDNEIISLKIADASVQGERWHTVYIDKNVTDEIKENYILPRRIMFERDPVTREWIDYPCEIFYF